MKKVRIILLVVSVLIALGNQSEAQTVLPNVMVESITGQEVSAMNFFNDGKPMIISFWATWCKPCILELDAISDEYDEWREETGVILLAVSIDDERSLASVKTLSAGRDWPFTIYLDKNQDLKRALNVVNVPHTFLLNGKGEIVWQHNSYVPGAEQELYEEILKLTENK
jgi:thiol-disulfide isomerase/thioredoxin